MPSIAVTGAHGLIGTALCGELDDLGHTVTPLVRGTPRSHEAHWDPEGPLHPSVFENIDAVVHLAGEPIAQRWTPAVKRRILHSRAAGTRTIAEAIAGCDRPPTLICSSAVGYYGDRGDDELHVRDEPGTGFLADVCRKWEHAADPARNAGARVVHVRTGIVLAAKGGALGKMLPPFKAGFGGRVGNGKQWWPWIALPDMVGLIEHALFSDLEGPVNAVAGTCRSAEFTHTLARVLGRPHFFPLPELAVAAMFGEMGKEVLLSSQRVVDGKSSHDYAHRFLEGALREVLGR